MHKIKDNNFIKLSKVVKYRLKNLQPKNKSQNSRMSNYSQTQNNFYSSRVNPELPIHDINKNW